MRVTEIYKASNAAEAHCVCQILDEAGIASRAVSGDVAFAGLRAGIDQHPVLVAAADAQRAREHLAARLEELGMNQSQAETPFQYGLSALLIITSLVAITLGLDHALGPELAQLLVLSFLGTILLIFAFVRMRRRRRDDD